MNSPENALGQRRLARRLVLLTLLASGLIAAFITAAQLYLEYDREIKDVQQRFVEIETAYLPSVKQGLWVMDRKALQVLTDGIRQLPDFEHAEVRVDGNPVATAGKPPASKQLTNIFEIDYEYRGVTQRIGTLEVAASNAGALRRTWERLELVLVLNGLKAAIVAALVLLLVRRMITDPLSRIHAHTRKMAGGYLEEALSLSARYPSSQNDEIHELAGAVEHMRTNLHNTTSVLIETNEQLTEAVAAKEIALMQVRAHAEQLELAAGVFANTREGIMITDTNNTILSVNPAFAHITGFSAEEALGQTPRLLRSYRQPESFYADLWKVLSASGEWRGEIWNRRKSGEAYLQLTSITTIKNANGQAYRRIAVMTDITDLRRKDEYIEHQTFHDALTNLPNRLLLQNRLDHAIKGALRESRRIAILWIGLDRFKVINDSLGHLVGDRLLQEAAKRLTQSARGSDTVSRRGGDEFVVLANMEHTLNAVGMAESIIADMARPFDIDGHLINSGASIGISVFPQDGSNVEVLLRNADIAMNVAKEDGRGVFRFFDTAMNDRAQKRLLLEEAMRRAIAGNEFELFYQAKICLVDVRYCGMEALIRWRDPQLGLVSPLDFIPLAEETGLIEPIGLWVLDTACAQMKRWADAGHISGPVAVNVSARQLDDPQFANKLQDVLDRHALAPDMLQLEVTESTVMSDPDAAIAALEKISALGISIAVDDFGTGYSSFSYLKRLPINVLKIDRSFVTDIGSSSEDEQIVAAIVQVAHALGLMVVAEGVETQSQAGFLGKLGCHFAQGYLYAKPLPAAEFERLLGA